MTDQRIELLQGMSVFGGIREEMLARLLGRARTVDVKTGEFFFREGETGNSAFVLEKGRVAIVKTWKGEEYFLRSLGAGDCFGEVALMDFFPRSASVAASEDCRAIEFHGHDLLELAKEDMEQFSIVYMNIGRDLARRLREANELLFQARIRYEDVAEGYAFRST